MLDQNFLVTNQSLGLGILCMAYNQHYASVGDFSGMRFLLSQTGATQMLPHGVCDIVATVFSWLKRL